MKRTSLARRNALLSGGSLSWGVSVLAVVLVVALVRFIAPNLFWRVVSPVFSVSSGVASATHTFFSSFENAAALEKKVEQLINENAALASENAALTEQLKGIDALGAVPQGIIAGVVARPPESPYDTLVVARGSATEVVSGMEAFGAGGVPLGVVTSVLTDFSRVTLFSSPTLTSSVVIGSKHVPVQVTGAGGGALRAVVARASSITEGDTVYAPGPGLLPIGTVARIDSDPSSPSVSLQIAPVSNPFMISWVELRATGPTFVKSLSFATSTLP